MPGKSIPSKSKTRKAIDSADGLWVAPRPTPQKSHQISPRTYEPVTGGRVNRYLEFADIALGQMQPGTSKAKTAKAGSKLGNEKPGPKAVSITGARRGFGAFRNSR
jgi:hypothetical protein